MIVPLFLTISTVAVEQWDDEFDFLPNDDTLHIPSAISASNVKLNKDLTLVRQFSDNSKGMI